ncbi:unnamed protein product [Miscanthus lutarioriparius]|uniref:Uncharacterized protein n=1 Tax=Miscanthus lutarioriparius TaxID=422564 RepID=A0A811Q7G2_9POAL|nr:unnamed protein product [Miscanthus lutarioriparius]
MASMKFDLPLLDYKTRFSLWQVKMRAILAQSSDLDEALDGFGGKGQKSWTAEEKWKDRKALSLIRLHLHNDILQEVLQKKTVAKLWLKLESICMSKDLTSKMHVKMKLFTHKLQEGGSVMNHLSIFKEIVANLVSMEMREKMKDMVQSDVSSSKGEVLQVRGRPEQRTYNNNNSRDKSKNGKGRSKSRGRDKFYRYCKKDTHVIEDCWKLQNKEKRNGSTLHGSVTAATVSNDEPSKTNLWHMRLGHMSELGMAELIKRDLLDGCVVGKMKFYEHCVFGKHKRVKFNASVHITKEVWPYFLKNKDDTFAAFKEWKVMIERQTEKKVENIHEPATYTEVVVSGDCEKWISAIQEEMQSLEKNGTWDVSKKEISTLKKLLSNEFEMKDLGATKKILGMEITRDKNSGLLFLSQQSYIKKVLHRFNMHDAKSVSTPIAPHFKLSALQCASTDEDFEYMSRVPYSSVVGSLMICHGLLSS